MRANILTTTVFRALLVLSIVVLASNMVFALSEQELLNKSAELQKDINSGKKKLGGVTKQVNTLQGKVNQLTDEINDIESKINKTSNRIDKTAEELKKTEKELERQEEIMNESLRSLYKHGSVSTIELLASSESFTQFINGQEYLSRVKVAVHESAAKIADLRDELKQKRADLDELLELHKGQRKIVASKKSEQDELLNKAKDEQFSYKKYVSKKQKQQEKAEEDLAALIRSKNQSNSWGASLGNANKNTVIGYTGNTGNSFGAHLHLSVLDSNGNYLDPVSSQSARTLKWGFTWPYNNNYPVSRWYGCTNFQAFATSSACVSSSNPNGYLHRGVDVAAPEGTPVRAIGNGEIVCRSYSCMGSSGGGTVIIRHPNGLTSVYNHMVL